MMRTEKQMFKLINDIALQDEKIRGVLLNGSRANKNAQKDIFQDFDIVYLVTDVVCFKNNQHWIDQFGKLTMMQLPRDMKLIPDKDDGNYTYLMLFEDGNRIDLTLVPVDNMSTLFPLESQTIVLQDKDNRFGKVKPADDSDFWIAKPTQKLFADCCNEFWWLCPYVIKGIYRDELPYTMHMKDFYLRKMLNQMIDWYIGSQHDYTTSVGKLKKYYKNLLGSNRYEEYKKTYCDSRTENIWNSLLLICDLFRHYAREVSGINNFEYNIHEENNMNHYIRQRYGEYYESAPNQSHEGI